MNNINEITITELSKKLRNKTISAKELIQEYLNQIKLLDKGDNGLNSIIEVNPDALEIAAKIDGKGFEAQGLLTGIPILLKDNINTGDKMHTSACSLALEESYASSDAELARRLRDQGAIFLGKTKMTEFANYMTEGMPSGYSSRGGVVKSPYKKSADPSGSSTGSGVATAANLCAASIGTDTTNSIVGPSLNNGIVGLRPSKGAISIQGIIPISFTLDTAGPMTRTVMDAAILFSELTKAQINLNELKDLSGITLGINEWSKETLTQEEILKTEEIIKELIGNGATLKTVKISPSKNAKQLMKYEFKYAINEYLSKLPPGFPIRTLQDIINFNQRHPELTLKYGQVYLQQAQENTLGDLSEAAYKEALEDRESQIQNIQQIMKDIDVCIMLKESNILQYTGLPIITIPCGLYKSGIPFGIMLTAKTDVELLKYAYIIEQLVGCRVEPPFVKEETKIK